MAWLSTAGPPLVTRELKWKETRATGYILNGEYYVTGSESRFVTRTWYRCEGLTKAAANAKLASVTGFDLNKDLTHPRDGYACTWYEEAATTWS